MRLFRWVTRGLEYCKGTLDSRVAPGTREEGRIVAMVPLASLAALICVGIGVDFSGQTIAEQNLRDQAVHCSRVGAGVIVMGTGNTTDAIDSAHQCLARFGRTGTVTVTPTTITVETASTYTTKLLSIIAINQLPVRGTASASLQQSR